MARSVTVNVDNVVVGDKERDTGATVTVSNEEFAELTSAGRFTDGTLTDNGAVADDGDDVSVQGTAVAAPAALTAAAAAGATPTKAEFDALLADVTALRGKVGELITALTGPDKPLTA